MKEQEKFIRSGIGIDIHKFSNEKLENNFIKIAGIDIKFPKKIIAHSDGDVVIHAIIDALLGAMAKGDIGDYFPDNDPKWQDIDSKFMLLEIKKLLEENSYQIVNIDLTIICEEPKISQYKIKMKERLSEILEIKLKLRLINFKPGYRPYNACVNNVPIANKSERIVMQLEA